MRMMDYIAFGKDVICKESRGLSDLAESLNEAFSRLCEEIIHLSGKVVVSGVGKAGLIGKKICATMASTGTPSIWLDPLNALHGDLGMVQKQDIVLLLSNSGTSDEILAVAQMLKALDVKLACFTKANDTPLSQLCDFPVPIGIHEEACPLRLAPSTSTTAMLALGDALALTIQKSNGFSNQDYAKLHPAGALGRSLRKISACMRPLENIAIATPDTPILEVMQRISEWKTGLCVIVDEKNILLGVFTDGDFRRTWQRRRDIYELSVSEVYNVKCHSINGNLLAAEALNIMREKDISILPVVNNKKELQGLLIMRDIV